MDRRERLHRAPDGPGGVAPALRHPAEGRAIVRRIEETLEHGLLRTVLQPVVDLRSGRVAAFEALSRFPPSPPRSPDAWFAEAGDVGLALRLEVAAVRAALAHLGRLPPGTYLSVNVSPATAAAPELAETLADAPASRLAVELTEHARHDDYGGLTTALDGLRRRGLKIVIDDAGAGFSSLKHILHLSPDAIKLDRTLTRGIETDPARRALVTALVTFGREIASLIVAEGIETRAELETLLGIGVGYGQGFYLARPRDPDVPLPRAIAAPGIPAPFDLGDPAAA